MKRKDWNRLNTIKGSPLWALIAFEIDPLRLKRLAAVHQEYFIEYDPTEPVRPKLSELQAAAEAWSVHESLPFARTDSEIWDEDEKYDLTDTENLLWQQIELTFACELDPALNLSAFISERWVNGENPVPQDLRQALVGKRIRAPILVTYQGMDYLVVEVNFSGKSPEVDEHILGIDEYEILTLVPANFVDLEH